jgi:hypothetical protein
MLIQLLNQLPFDKPCTERLECLENKLRRKSDGKMTLKNYIKWLEEAEIVLPTRRTLTKDLRRYADFCDDVQYGGETKSLSLNPTATRDAVAWLLGHAWLDSPLRPKLSSSCVRSLLLAKELQEEVDFPYNPLRKPGEAWKPQLKRGIPLKFIPGADSSYMQLQVDWGGKSNLNLAHIRQSVKFTEDNTQEYAPLKEEQYTRITVESTDIFLIEGLQRQFSNFVIREGGHKATLQIEKSQALMARDMLKAYLERTQTSNRQIPPQQNIGNTMILYEEL